MLILPINVNKNSRVDPIASSQVRVVFLLSKIPLIGIIASEQTNHDIRRATGIAGRVHT
jgi:hypothetical protein